MKYLRNLIKLVGCSLTLDPIGVYAQVSPTSPSSNLNASEFEQIPEGEAEDIAKIQKLISDQIIQNYPDSVRPAKRDAHAKHHGCVMADFQVNEVLDPALAFGVFKPKASYKAWIRYSNGSGKSQMDSVGDGRGMAVKLTGISGDKILEAERIAQTQDFLMINHPVFFVENAKNYVDFSTQSAKGSPFFYFIGFNPFKWHLNGLSIAKSIQKKVTGNPLKIRYWSMTPYFLGHTPVKFSAKPCREGDDAPGSDNDYLRAAMRNTLNSESVCFDFLVQRQTDSVKMPVEDPTIEWDDGQSPYVAVAKISIPKQQFESADQMNFCENLSMTPWHSLPEHRPLGGINRVRKAVYETISNLRHQLNGVVRTEPTGTEIFK